MSLSIFGTNGAGIYFCKSLSHYMFLSHGWPFISSASLFDPNLFFGFFFNKHSKKLWHSSEIFLGNSGVFLSIFENSWSLEDPLKAGSPLSSSYKIDPKVHQSTYFPCYLLIKISGAKYSGVPQIVLLFCYFVFLDNPKSAILM